MKKLSISILLLFVMLLLRGQEIKIPLKAHPDVSKWKSLISCDLKEATFPEGVWTCQDGVFTASKDEAMWSAQEYENFVLDLEFKTDHGTNSGVIVYCTDKQDWIPNSVEIQIADDYAEEWSKAAPTWHCAAIFGHLAPKKSVVKEAGQWNRMTITCVGQKISVILNNELVTEMDMSLWTSAKVNPDGSEIPSWLSRPFAGLATRGFIGFQGKHAGAPIYFRNIKIKELK